MSSYSNYHKKYYDSKKEEISLRNKENNYWQNYYEKNKEKIKEKAKIRYQKKKELNQENI
jgi:hypothetical protein